ncbi:Endonuclease/exonuclease/phosphatase [Penicillium sp. IBT 31633x]|nr:Endonuclease/exonuclease/phosphatase [Penicillium sp. IBT 31633x]
MDIYAQVSSTVASWRKDTPLPNNPSAPPKFQFWHEFNPTSKQWEPVSPNETTQQSHPSNTSDISLLTWNIDALSKHSHERVTEILSFITDPPS